jgi:hypothetical protein
MTSLFDMRYQKRHVMAFCPVFEQFNFVFNRAGEVLVHDVTAIWGGGGGWGGEQTSRSVKCRCLQFLKPCPCCSLAALVLSNRLWHSQFSVIYYAITFVSDVNTFYAFCLFLFVIVFVSWTCKCSRWHCRKVPRVKAKTCIHNKHAKRIPRSPSPVLPYSCNEIKVWCFGWPSDLCIKVSSVNV